MIRRNRIAAGVAVLVATLAVLSARPAAGQDFTTAACVAEGDAPPRKPDLKPTVTNQSDVGRAMARLYGPLAANKVMGLANMCVLIGETGEVKNVRLLTSTGNTDLDVVAVEIARTLRFRPLTVGGSPASEWQIVPLSFAGPPGPCVHYDTDPVTLAGTLFYELDYGPPNFGETPAIDEKGYYPMIRLDRPIETCEAADAEAESSVSELQLVFSSQPVPPRAEDGRPVQVTGTLFHAMTGFHHRPVLLTVRTFAFAPR